MVITPILLEFEFSFPFSAATWEGHPLVSALLVWMGADLSLVNCHNLTPKDEARGEAVKMFQALTKYGLQGLANEFPTLLELRVSHSF